MERIGSPIEAIEYQWTSPVTRELVLLFSTPMVVGNDVMPNPFILLKLLECALPLMRRDVIFNRYTTNLRTPSEYVFQAELYSSIRSIFASAGGLFCIFFF